MNFADIENKRAVDFESINKSDLIDHQELRRIRALTPLAFEKAFEEQLRTERKQTLLSVYFMKEAYRRHDWSKTHSSFRDYCTKQMKMSDSDFYRKFGIMRTLSEIPEIEEKIIDGTLNQSTVSKAIQFINKESRIEDRKITVDEKREIFLQIENLTEQQVEREFAIRSPEAAILDKTK